MGVGGGKWIVRYRNKASKAMRLPKAREYALDMVKGIWAGRILTDPIRNLHQEHLRPIKKAKPAPLNIMGVAHQWHNPCPVNRETVAEILRSEVLIDANPIKPALPAPALQGDDCPIEYDEKGYPELPDCL